MRAATSPRDSRARRIRRKPCTSAEFAIGRSREVGPSHERSRRKRILPSPVGESARVSRRYSQRSVRRRDRRNVESTRSPAAHEATIDRPARIAGDFDGLPYSHRKSRARVKRCRRVAPKGISPAAPSLAGTNLMHYLARLLVARFVNAGNLVRSRASSACESQDWDGTAGSNSGRMILSRPEQRREPRIPGHRERRVTALRNKRGEIDHARRSSA